MPELPEVEVVRRGLESALAKKPKISQFVFMRKDIRDAIPIKQLQRLEGAEIESIERRAKYLIIRTSKGGILSHLGMTGAWRIVANEKQLNLISHDHVQIKLSDGRILVYNDPRRFGMFETIDLTAIEKNPRIKDLGPEPFSQAFDANYLKQQLAARKTAIKTAIMDQKIVVGVGNIYASEVLFHVGIAPGKIASKVPLDQCDQLVKQIRITLQESIEKGGSTISNFLNTSGQKGDYQQNHKVYGREGEKCVRDCGGVIKSKVLGGRSTFWCPRCQK